MRADAALWKVEHQLQGVLDSAQLVVREVSDSPTERSGVDDADHLAEDLRRLAADHDLRMKAGSECRAGSRAENDRGEGEQIVGLDDYRITSACLNVTALSWGLDAVDITADHAASP